MGFPPPEVIPEGHAFAETRKLHSNDIHLRRAGFRIERRPKRTQAVWSKDGILYTQSEAEAVAFGGK
jgi:hypothetical protein